VISLYRSACRLRVLCLGSAAGLWLAAPALGAPALPAPETQSQDAAATAPAAEAATQAPAPPGQASSAAAEPAPAGAESAVAPATEQVVITGVRTQLLGTATTSSQGIILPQEVHDLPAFRPGQLLETVPGLVVTSHSGEGKANQYLLRGFNLDHGTDLATFVDGMPINMRTHAHGQGYTDLNFLIPELVGGIDYTKGPYFAAQGDFSSVGSDHIGYLNEIPDQAKATVGTLGYERLFGAMTRDVSGGHFLSALALDHYNGPWVHPDNFRKLAGVLRYSQGEATEGWSVTGMYYRGLWNATTDQPQRAMDTAYMASLGLQPISRFGSVDPTDGGQAQRMSLSGVYSHGTLDYHVDANAYVINNRLTLWNDFTHYLEDPVNGDQYAQNDTRMIYGGSASYTNYGMLFGANSEALVGFDGRYDDIHVDHIHTKARVPLPYGAANEDDRVNEGSIGGYAQLTDYWTEWFRSVLGVREDYFSALDRGTNQGSPSETLFQPKGSLIFTPLDWLELYVSGGRGFHSDDVRGSTQTGAPLLAHSTGEEVGVRTSPLRNFTATVTLFQITFQSELTYDADIGQTSAGPPSKRTGLEINTTYTPFDWLEIYTSVAFTHARYTADDPAGSYIPDAPAAIANLALYVRNLGPWSGSLEWRYLGPHPLIEDNSKRSSGYQEWNMEVGYDFGSGFSGLFGIYNLLDSSDNAAEYYYTDRLPGEPVDGISDFHIHPLEPRNFRFTLTKMF
jgi:TonB dependent receptor-like, beta-barrel/TonB-dependent Receptor Plug Domain